MTDLDRAVEEARELLNRSVLETGTVVRIATGEVFEFPALLDAYASALAAQARQPLVKALEKLADAERRYRWVYETYGDGTPETGYVWDVMRKAGDEVRALLAHTKEATK